MNRIRKKINRSGACDGFEIKKQCCIILIEKPRNILINFVFIYLLNYNTIFIVDFKEIFAQKKFLFDENEQKKEKIKIKRKFRS